VLIADLTGGQARAPGAFAQAIGKADAVRRLPPRQNLVVAHDVFWPTVHNGKLLQKFLRPANSARPNAHPHFFKRVVVGCSVVQGGGKRRVKSEAQACCGGC
jgi:hypothetical protein